ncbi:MAG: ACT domain-containing protein [bacterium]
MIKEESMEHFIVSGIVLNEKEAKVTIKQVPDQPGMAGFIFRGLAEVNINVDMIVQSSAKEGTNDISFTVKEGDLNDVKKVMEKIKKKIQVKEVVYDSDMAKVSLVGAGMQSHPGVAARMFTALGREGINIDMISTSEIKISCAVKKREGKQAVRVIHREFELDKEAEA